MDRAIVAGAGALVVAAGVAPLLPSYPLTLLTQVAIMAVLAMSLDVLLGYTGLPSLGHAAYFGVAAYAVGILATEHRAGFVVCLAAAIAPLLSSYPLTLLTQAVIVAILAMSLDVLLGYTGLASLGHAAYFGIAAYAVGILTTQYQMGFATCFVVGVAIAAGTAALFGLLAIRATGTYFLMITLALGMVVWGLAFRWVSMTKGDNGITGIPRPEVALPWSLWSPLPFFYFALAALLLAWACLAVLVRSPFGLSLKGIRESETRMRALGYNVWLHKYLAFVVSGTFAGFAGVFWAYYNGFVSPVDVQLVTSVETLLMVALGGPGTLGGSALGAAVIVFLKNYVSVYTKRWLLILGAVYIGVILFAPRGVFGAFRREPR